MSRVADCVLELRRFCSDEFDKVPYGEFAAIVFPEREFSALYGSLWNIVTAYAERALDEHPYLYGGSISTLWTPHKAPEDEPDQQPDVDLTGLGVMLAVDAWQQEAIIRPGVVFSDAELADLQFWRMHSSRIICQVFEEHTLPTFLRGSTNPEMERRMSNMWFQETVARASVQTGHRAPVYNRERYAQQFSRIQAFSMTNVPGAEGTQHAHAYFLPATQIVSHMSRYFRSSTVFEEQRWRTSGSYQMYAQFTNIMLLNLCNEVSRQISAMFCMQESRNPDALLMPVDSLLDSEQLMTMLPTLTERILGHAEPTEWMPSITVNLQRFLSGGSAPPAASGRRQPRTKAAAEDQGLTDTAISGPGSQVRSTQKRSRVTGSNTSALRVDINEPVDAGSED